MLWLKAFHVVSFVSWYAGLFYLPRLFVYHAETHDPPGHERFVVMERRLFVMMTIGLVATLVTGGWLAFAYWSPFPGWLNAKLALVAVLVAHHGLCLRYLRGFAEGTNQHRHRFYRWFNEVPTVVLLGIVYLVFFKPF